MSVSIHATPKCNICQKPCWYDTNKGRYAPGCCKYHTNLLNPTMQSPVQGQPLCVICLDDQKRSVASFFDGNKFAPGCTRSHSLMAIQRGKYYPY